MKLKQFLFNVLGLLLACSSTATFAADNYQLHQGDVLFISVWGEETLQKEARVLPDGSITFPLAGRVDVANASTADAEKRITEKLKTFLPDPQVTVVVTGLEGNRAYVIGKVLRTGPILLTGPTTVLQALSMAGGFDKFADLNDIKVLHNLNGKQSVTAVNYEKLIKGENLESNILLQSGDTLLVP